MSPRKERRKYSGTEQNQMVKLDFTADKATGAAMRPAAIGADNLLTSSSGHGNCTSWN
jgi:hypothetical protein